MIQTNIQSIQKHFHSSYSVLCSKQLQGHFLIHKAALGFCSGNSQNKEWKNWPRHNNGTSGQQSGICSNQATVSAAFLSATTHSSLQKQELCLCGSRRYCNFPAKLKNSKA